MQQQIKLSSHHLDKQNDNYNLQLLKEVTQLEIHVSIILEPACLFRPAFWIKIITFPKGYLCQES